MHQEMLTGAVLTYGGLGREQRRAHGATHHRGPGSPGLQAGRNEQGGRPPHAGAGQGARRGPGSAGGAAALPVRPRASLRGARHALRPPGRRAAAARTGRAAALGVPGRRARPRRRAVPLRAAPSSSTRSRRSGEAEDRVYRLALAVVRAVEDGAEPALVLRYLEAWLLRLHGLYPPLDRCATCAGGWGRAASSTTAPPTASCAARAGRRRGPSWRPRPAPSSSSIFSRPPATLAGAGGAPCGPSSPSTGSSSAPTSSATSARPA